MPYIPRAQLGGPKIKVKCIFGGLTYVNSYQHDRIMHLRSKKIATGTLFSKLVKKPRKKHPNRVKIAENRKRGNNGQFEQESALTEAES